MQIESRNAGPLVVVSVKGRIDHAGAPALEAALVPYLDAATAQSPLLLDLSAVDYIASVGLRVLMLASRKAVAHKARFALAGLQPLVKEVFQISRFHLVVELHDSVEAGVAALGGAA